MPRMEMIEAVRFEIAVDSLIAIILQSNIDKITSMMANVSIHAEPMEE